MDDKVFNRLQYLRDELQGKEFALSIGLHHVPGESVEAEIINILSELGRMANAYDELGHLRFDIGKSVDSFDHIPILIDLLDEIV